MRGNKRERRQEIGLDGGCVGVEAVLHYSYFVRGSGRERSVGAGAGAATCMSVAAGAGQWKG